MVGFPKWDYPIDTVVMPDLQEREKRGVQWLRDGFPELQQPTGALIAALKEGLPADRVETLKEAVDVPATQLIDLLGIPSSTLARRRQAGRLGKDESERAYRIAHLVARTAEVFGSLERARQWLKKPQVALGGATPLAFADTEPGAREVEDLLLRIEHGIPV